MKAGSTSEFERDKRLNEAGRTCYGGRARGRDGIALLGKGLDAGKARKTGMALVDFRHGSTSGLPR